MRIELLDEEQRQRADIDLQEFRGAGGRESAVYTIRPVDAPEEWVRITKEQPSASKWMIDSSSGGGLTIEIAASLPIRPNAPARVTVIQVSDGSLLLESDNPSVIGNIDSNHIYTTANLRLLAAAVKELVTETGLERQRAEIRRVHPFKALLMSVFMRPTASAAGRSVVGRSSCSPVSEQSPLTSYARAAGFARMAQQVCDAGCQIHCVRTVLGLPLYWCDNGSFDSADHNPCCTCAEGFWLITSCESYIIPCHMWCGDFGCCGGA